MIVYGCVPLHMKSVTCCRLTFLSPVQAQHWPCCIDNSNKYTCWHRCTHVLAPANDHAEGLSQG